MAGILIENEAEKQKGRVLPTIRRQEPELHTPLYAMVRAADNMHLQTEANYTSVAAADRGMQTARNVQELRLDASRPLSERFAGLLQALG